MPIFALLLSQFIKMTAGPRGHKDKKLPGPSTGGCRRRWRRRRAERGGGVGGGGGGEAFAHGGSRGRNAPPK